MPYLLDYHQDRMNRTFRESAKECPINLSEIFKAASHNENGLFKWRLLYGLDGQYRSQFIPYAFREEKRFTLVTDNTLKYSHKHENRRAIDALKSSVGTSEIIIVQNGHITDTSFSNLIFLKNNRWYTPSTYLLKGVQRESLLAKNQITATEITVSGLHEYSHFKMINALNHPDDAFVYPTGCIVNIPPQAAEEDY